MSAKKAVELGFADKVLYEDDEETDGEGFIFDKVTVTNNLLGKFPKVRRPKEEPEAKPEVDTNTSYVELEKRLNLIK